MKSRSLVDSTLKNIATLGPVGYLPIAPGTWGTLAALIFIIILKPSLAVQSLVLAGVMVTGVISSTTAERVIGQCDSGHIIIDEFAGFLVSVLFVPHTLNFLLAAFFLFRFFDIIKPLMISKLERTLSRGMAVMADDILAGIYTNLLLQIWIMTFSR